MFILSADVMVLYGCSLPHAVIFNFNGAEETNWQAAHGFITGHECVLAPPLPRGIIRVIALYSRLETFTLADMVLVGTAGALNPPSRPPTTHSGHNVRALV